MDPNRQMTRFNAAAKNALAQKTIKHPRKQRDDVDLEHDGGGYG